MKLVLFSRDLMLLARVEGAARQNDLTVVNAAEMSLAVTACADESARLLLIDLRFPDLEIAELVDQVRHRCADKFPIIACGPHVHEARLAQAQAAGCDLVVTRGQLDRDLETILQRIAGSGDL